MARAVYEKPANKIGGSGGIKLRMSLEVSLISLDAYIFLVNFNKNKDIYLLFFRRLYYAIPTQMFQLIWRKSMTVQNIFSMFLIDVPS